MAVQTRHCPHPWRTYDLSVPTIVEVEHLLVSSLSWTSATQVEKIGEGAWSTAFGFREGGRDLVIRIGRHESDFRRDQAMSSLATPALPIPEVIEVGRVPGADASMRLHYCVSTRAFGVPLESCGTQEWPAVAELVADAMEAMRAWTPHKAAVPSADRPVLPWQEQLLAIERDDLDPRGAGWPAKLATSPRGSEAFTVGLGRLQAIDLDEVPLTLVHGDLINRNVHLEGESITGIFDWGCQRWGDHLFDLAWFDFWAPWHPNLDIDLLRAALGDRWSAADYKPKREAERINACLVYIGLEHLIYNATVDRWVDLDDVADRMEALDLI